MKKNIAIFFITAVSAVSGVRAQRSDSLFIRRIYDEALLNGHAYKRLEELCKGYGSRLSGSDHAERAVTWAGNMLRSYGFDTVMLQPCMVPRWQRGKTELLSVSSPLLNKRLKQFNDTAGWACEALEERYKKQAASYLLPACALGGSVGTNGSVSGSLCVVQNQAELETLGKAGRLKGCIVLFNEPFDEKKISTFSAYGGCVYQRVNGASLAARYGARAVLVRSMSNSCDLHPHTGVMHYVDSLPQIPAMAVATSVANTLAAVADDPKLVITISMDCQTLPDRLSHNVIAEERGATFPNRYIAFGGHFDSWDQGEGAHDDGAGCMHAFEALRLLKALGYTPRHTLRCVFWMNEENGARGAHTYAEQAAKNGEFHVAAIESDRGGFTPRGFSIDAEDAGIAQIKTWTSLLAPYGIHQFEKGGAGVDVAPLKHGPNSMNKSMLQMGLIPDSQRYFDYHHAETDVFESVNRRELHLGAATLAAMIYLLDQTLE
ncbi:MAG: M20/M25/M40 family metallo-hydrolase [Bacteroidetes bacterium]|nr:M20/M25/M40 family metallo-hydrolase [Bacteroidota bacterium]